MAEKDIITKNVQKSGKSAFVYLPTEWCKEHGLFDGGSIHIERKPTGELVLHASMPKSKSPERTLRLKEIPHILLDKVIASAYLTGLNSFIISGQDLGKKVDMLNIKHVLPGMELMSIDSNSVEFNCTIKLENLKEVQQSMMKKVINQVRLVSHENRKLTEQLEDDVDRNYFLLERAMRTALIDPCYRKELGLTTVKCLYLVHCTRMWERISDMLKHIKIKDESIISKIEEVLTSLYFAVNDSSIKEIEKTMMKLNDLKKIVNKKAMEAKMNAENKIGIFHAIDYTLITRMMSTVEDIVEVILDDYNTTQLLESEGN